MRGPAHLDSTSKITPQTATRSLPAVTAPELRYPQEACELKDDVLYRTWVLLAKNVPATIEKLREQNLDPVHSRRSRRPAQAQGFASSAVRNRHLRVPEEQSARARGYLPEADQPDQASENHQEIRFCNREGDRGRSKVERASRVALVHDPHPEGS